MREMRIRIHESNNVVFQAKLNELNAKFAKKGLPLISAEFDNRLIASDEQREYIPVTLRTEFEQTNLKGIDVRYEGVVSLVDKDESSKVYSLQNPLIPSLLRDCECDECHKRLGRNKYIVFSKADREVRSREDLIVLGSQCARNYFPFSVEGYFSSLTLAFDELYAFDEDSCGSRSHGANSVSIYELFDAVMCVSDNFKAYVGEGETKRLAVSWLCDSDWDKYTSYRDRFPMPENPVEFSDMKEWLCGAYLSPRDTFSENVRSVMFCDGMLRDRIPNKFIGIAVYAFVGARRAHEKALERKLAEEARARQNEAVVYYGAVGEKFELELTFDRLTGFDSCYGYCYVLLFHDDSNHVFKWSSSKGSYSLKGKDGKVRYYEYEVGHKYMVKGTVKSHEEYKGCRQTSITRCKVTDDFYGDEEEALA